MKDRLTRGLRRQTVYFEEDRYRVKWLNNLADLGVITTGRVFKRAIEAILPDETRGYKHVHLFANIGVWSYALKLAGWTTERPVWTASIPLQPFNAKSAKNWATHKLNEWPAVFNLVRECRPPTLFIDCSAKAVQAGWLDTVSGDLEGCGYSVGAAVLSTASVGAPCIGKKLYVVAHHVEDRRPQEARTDSGLASSNGTGLQRRNIQKLSETPVEKHIGTGSLFDYWKDCEWIESSDGRIRAIPPSESGIRPLAHGFSTRMGTMQAYGSCMDPHVAKTFVEEVKKILQTTHSVV